MRQQVVLLGFSLFVVSCAPDYPMPEVSGVQGIVLAGVTVVSSSGSHRAQSAKVPAGFFMQDSNAWLGRLFVESEFEPGARNVTVLTHEFWTRLGAAPNLVGSEIRLGTETIVVIGVTPPGFAAPEGVDLWLPR